MGFDGIVNIKSGQFTQAPVHTKTRARLRLPQADLAQRIEELEDRVATLESAIAVRRDGTVTLRGQDIYIDAGSFIYLSAKSKVMTENLKVKTFEYTKAEQLKFFG